MHWPIAVVPPTEEDDPAAPYLGASRAPDESPTVEETWAAMEALLATGPRAPLHPCTRARLTRGGEQGK
jgi:hypothetical protein